MPAARHRSTIWPSRQRFTLVEWSRQISIIDFDGVGGAQRAGEGHWSTNRRSGAPPAQGFRKWGITREFLEDFLVWMAASTQWSTNTRHHTITFVKVLLDWGHRHGTLAGLPTNAVIYEEEVSRPADQLPRFIPEFVMNQLELDALDQSPE